MASLLLKNMPPDIRKYLLLLQANAKMEKDRKQYSMEATIYRVIKLQMELENKKQTANNSI